LRDEPRPPGAEKLSARERYRFRQGNYRILYTVVDAEQTVEVVKLGTAARCIESPRGRFGVESG
jgi:mRNA interferase RelE/StbE